MSTQGNASDSQITCGTQAPDFALKSTDGKTVKLSSFAGGPLGLGAKPVVSQPPPPLPPRARAWCPPLCLRMYTCRWHLPQFIAYPTLQHFIQSHAAWRYTCMPSLPEEPLLCGTVRHLCSSQATLTTFSMHFLACTGAVLLPLGRIAGLHQAG